MHQIACKISEYILNKTTYLCTSTFKGVPNGSQRVSIHHPLGFNWHPFEGTGICILYVCFPFMPFVCSYMFSLTTSEKKAETALFLVNKSGPRHSSCFISLHPYPRTLFCGRWIGVWATSPIFQTICVSGYWMVFMTLGR